MGLKNLSEFINFYLTDQPIYKEEKTYSELKQELKEEIDFFFEQDVIKNILRKLHNPNKLKENWLDIRNLNILKEALLQIVKFIDNPTYKNLDLVKWFVNEFRYSKKINCYERLYMIFSLIREKGNLGQAIIPLVNEILKAYHKSDDEDDSEYDDDIELIIETSDSDSD